MIDWQHPGEVDILVLDRPTDLTKQTYTSDYRLPGLLTALNARQVCVEYGIRAEMLTKPNVPIRPELVCGTLSNFRIAEEPGEDTDLLAKIVATFTPGGPCVDWLKNQTHPLYIGVGMLTRIRVIENIFTKLIVGFNYFTLTTGFTGRVHSFPEDLPAWIERAGLVPDKPFTSAVMTESCLFRGRGHLWELKPSGTLFLARPVIIDDEPSITPWHQVPMNATTEAEFNRLLDHLITMNTFKD